MGCCHRKPGHPVAVGSPQRRHPAGGGCGEDADAAGARVGPRSSVRVPRRRASLAGSDDGRQPRPHLPGRQGAGIRPGLARRLRCDCCRSPSLPGSDQRSAGSGKDGPGQSGDHRGLPAPGRHPRLSSSGPAGRSVGPVDRSRNALLLVCGQGTRRTGPRRLRRWPCVCQTPWSWTPVEQLQLRASV